MNKASIDIKDQSKKSFIRRFWWTGIILIILIAFCIIAINSKNDKNQSNNEKKSSESWLENLVQAENLPACPADTSTLFSKPFMDGDKPDYIIPLGNSSQSGHVIPTDHVYPQLNTFQANTPIYAPGKLTLVSVENKQIYNKNTNEEVAPDYQLNFAPCRGINLAFIHFTKVSDKVSSAIIDPINSKCEENQKIDYGTRNGVPVYYSNCHPDIKQVTIEAGELIGYFGYNDTDKPQQGFDIGIYDFNKPALAFINPDRYYRETVHTTCFTDYYTAELKAKYNAKFGGPTQNTGTFIQRTTGSVCGQVMYDIAGTAQGDWFKGQVKQGNSTDQDALALIYDNIQPAMAKMSWAGITSFLFTPVHTGTTNRDFSEVKADGKIYCYQGLDNQGGSNTDKKGQPITSNITKYLIQLVDNTHLKAEVQSGTCGTSESFNSSFTYER